MKALRVVVVFEFDGIVDADSPEADRIVEMVSMDSEWCSAWGADSVWIENAFVVDKEEA